MHSLSDLVISICSMGRFFYLLSEREELALKLVRCAATTDDKFMLFLIGANGEYHPISCIAPDLVIGDARRFSEKSPIDKIVRVKDGSVVEKGERSKNARHQLSHPEKNVKLRKCLQLRQHLPAIQNAKYTCAQQPL